MHLLFTTTISCKHSYPDCCTFPALHCLHPSPLLVIASDPLPTPSFLQPAADGSSALVPVAVSTGAEAVTLSKDRAIKEYKVVVVTADAADSAFDGDVYLTLSVRLYMAYAHTSYQYDMRTCEVCAQADAAHAAEVRQPERSAGMGANGVD